MFLKMTQHRPETSGHEPTSAFKLTGVSRDSPKFQPDKCAALFALFALQPKAHQASRSWAYWIWAYWTAVHQLWQDRPSDVYWKQVPYDSALTSFQTRSQHLLNSRKHKLKSQPRCIHLLFRQRPLTRACLYDNQCWFVMLMVAFAFARTVSRLHLLLQKA